MVVLTDFGKRVKELRLKAGITQESLAIRAELDRSYVGAIERGEKNLSLLNIESWPMRWMWICRICLSTKVLLRVPHFSNASLRNRSKNGSSMTST
ncbi:helix-turn-helix domain-containing protein [Planococcus sp. FY231025]|uniref:helix-turn-helix domain-containing protein n=1 Tax=Planococcus sp. FY231025 TaxID=3455699 RepID=UPI003F92C3A8